MWIIKCNLRVDGRRGQRAACEVSIDLHLEEDALFGRSRVHIVVTCRNERERNASEHRDER